MSNINKYLSIEEIREELDSKTYFTSSFYASHIVIISFICMLINNMFLHLTMQDIARVIGISFIVITIIDELIWEFKLKKKINMKIYTCFTLDGFRTFYIVDAITFLIWFIFFTTIGWHIRLKFNGMDDLISYCMLWIVNASSTLILIVRTLFLSIKYILYKIKIQNK